jgi:phage baseplate assembly protein W
MRPDFGCGIHDLVFAVTAPSTCDRIAGQVREALVRWEPRIEVEEVQARQDGRGEKLFLHVTYRVRATNNAFNIVYPFYLEGRGA